MGALSLKKARAGQPAHLATSAGVEQSEATKPEQMAEHRWHSRLSPVYTTIDFFAVSYVVSSPRLTSAARWIAGQQPA